MVAQKNVPEATKACQPATVSQPMYILTFA